MNFVYITLVCIVSMSTSLHPMWKKESLPETNRLTSACKSEAFGTERPTSFDNTMKKELEKMRQTNPDKYNRLTSAAQQRSLEKK